jgi:hypothetical protein
MGDQNGGGSVMAAEVVVVLAAAVVVLLGVDLIEIMAGTTCGSGIQRRSRDRTRPQQALMSGG